MEDQVAWETSHSVEAEAPVSFAWSYLTDVSNWDDPPATFQLNGPFEEGARGVTLVPGQEPRPWLISHVEPGESYVLEMDLEGAKLSFTWRFEGVSENTCRLTQTITLAGEAAANHASGIEQGFGPTLAPGMDRIAATVGRAASSDRSAVEQQDESKEE